MRLAGIPVTNRTVAGAATTNACVVCAGSPLLLGPLAGMGAGLIVVGTIAHFTLFLLAPLNLFFLYRGHRAHRNRSGLILGGMGASLLLIHMFGHLGAFDWLVGETHIATTDIELLFPERWLLGIIPTWIGSVLLASGVYLDIRARWTARSTLLGCGSPEEYWKAILTGAHGGLREGRELLKRIPAPPRCAICNAPFAGIGGWLMRAIGRGPSRLNPRFCGSCLSRTPIGGTEIEATLVFADVRGSTGAAESMEPTEFAGLMERFYRESAEVLSEHDALIQGFVGDEIIGVFVPGFAGADYTDQAITAALQLLSVTGHSDPDGPWVPIGVGVHSGTCYVGLNKEEQGRINLGVLGDVPNVAARLASSAPQGVALISDAALFQSSFDTADLQRKRLVIKGRSDELQVAELDLSLDRTSVPV